MKTICIFICTTIFSATVAKYFLIETDKEEGNEAGDIEVEMDKEGFELKPSTTHTVGANTGHVCNVATVGGFLFV